jgi:hypothetical protein
LTGILTRQAGVCWLDSIALWRRDMGDLLTRLGDDDFFSLTDAIEELDDVCGGFGEGDVGDHGMGVGGFHIIGVEIGRSPQSIQGAIIPLFH